MYAMLHAALKSFVQARVTYSAALIAPHYLTPCIQLAGEASVKFVYLD